jgi:hypothetical protein
MLPADGGALVFQKQSGAFLISVFSSPTPVTSGPVDLSVLVQDAVSHSMVEDARVTLKIGRSAVEINAPASHEQAINKLLYAAQVNLPPGLTGDWRLNVKVATPDASVETDGDLRVSPNAPPAVTYWPYFAAVPLVMGLFALNRWLKSTRR